MWTSSLSQLPVILIATSSILADRSFRYDLIQDRFRCQIWLWLAIAVSLYPTSSSTNHHQDSSSHNNPEESSQTTLVFETWIHLILFSNILVVSTVSSMSTNMKVSSSSSRRSYKKAFLVVDLLPIAAWCAMMSTLFAAQDVVTDSSHHNTTMMISIQVFVVAIVVLYVTQWHFLRKQKLSKELRGMPAATAGTSSSSMMIVHDNHNTNNILQSHRAGLVDESIWYTWNVPTTLKWMSCQVSEEEEDNDDERDYLVSLLAPHRISGETLDRLTNPAELVQLLNFPYGPACRLAQAIDYRLVRMHPKPRNVAVPYDNISFPPQNRRSSDDPSLASDYTRQQQLLQQQQEQHQDWLSLHDQEYNQWASRHAPVQSLSNSHDHNTTMQHTVAPVVSPSTSSQADIPPMDPDQQSRLESLMREKYGLELPRLAGSTAELPHQAGKATTPTHQVPLQQQSPAAARLPSNPQLFHHTKFPSSPQPLPPQQPTTTISNETKIGSNTKDNSLASDNPILQSIFKQMPPHIQDIARRRPELLERLLAEKQQQQTIETIQEEEEGNDEEGQDDETTRLIQRRARATKYKSVESNGKDVLV